MLKLNLACLLRFRAAVRGWWWGGGGGWEGWAAGKFSPLSDSSRQQVTVAHAWFVLGRQHHRTTPGNTSKHNKTTAPRAEGGKGGGHVHPRMQDSHACNHRLCGAQKSPDRTSRQARLASATALLRTGEDLCKTGSGAGQRAGAKSEPVRRRRNHEQTEEKAGWRKRAYIDAVGAGGCTPQTTHEAGTPRQDPSTATSCAKVSDGPGQEQGRAGMGHYKPWQQQQGHDWKETPL